MQASMEWRLPGLSRHAAGAQPGERRVARVSELGDTLIGPAETAFLRRTWRLLSRELCES
ncbi:hypothetical protein [Candidatus Methylacidithermus pantelleriae]|uniref:hypothetical protein n=1 Tax=Candidatus Methylacidithermus pantelleriae TaxID=2744239 RepID=UPI00157C2DF8|nr:hypothetical protein [Candidatus Methylacidithermus pantelleriae]